ncbi:MAG: hypothetical protein ACYTEG_11695, partial [Planctomycetota bacterium]
MPRLSRRTLELDLETGRPGDRRRHDLLVALADHELGALERLGRRAAQHHLAAAQHLRIALRQIDDHRLALGVGGEADPDFEFGDFGRLHQFDAVLLGLLVAAFEVEGEREADLLELETVDVVFHVRLHRRLAGIAGVVAIDDRHAVRVNLAHAACGDDDVLATHDARDAVREALRVHLEVGLLRPAHGAEEHVAAEPDARVLRGGDRTAGEQCECEHAEQGVAADARRRQDLGEANLRCRFDRLLDGVLDQLRRHAVALGIRLPCQLERGDE